MHRLGGGPERAQRREQLLDRPLPHPGVAVDDVIAVPESQEGGQEAHRRPGVADRDPGLHRGNVAAAPLDLDRGALAARGDARGDTDGAEGGHEMS